MMTVNKDRDSGFSLLEMIVSLTILSLLLGIASQTIILATRSIAAANKQNDALTEMRAVLANYPSKFTGPNDSHRVISEQDVVIGKIRLKALVISGPKQQPFLTFVPQFESASP